MDSSVVPRRPAALGLLGFGLAVLVVAVVGGLASASAGEQYASLEQPDWAPPSWLFGPVWTVLYVLIAISGWLVWRRAGFAGARTALIVYAVQLVLNMLWSPLFFGAGLAGLAFAEIVVLWLAVVATIVAFAGIHKLAAGLLAPYLAWVTFAAALNFGIWQLNG
ncbi:MAG: tryptophan-rich sensory protein [Pseudonocardia sp.]|nr:tryptophan-rich sensory protein [Pseudonocardia sp.]